jgi:UDP-N-acetylmuramoyl-tripeptide--D-alanyl-D-alanine ligase
MIPPLWSYSDLVTVLRAQMIGLPRAAVRGISIDTRTLQPGDAFFAITGDARDGHAFARKALDAGAAVAVVARAKLRELDHQGPWLVVDDVLEAMVRLGIEARARSPARIAAVTGSVGKTGTKEALRLALSGEGEVHASVASYNNHWGVPLTLARMPVSAAFGVFEIGMNHAGEITPLTGYVRPHVAIVTTVEAVHLEFFPNVEGIAEAKAEIFLGLEPRGSAVINRDNPYYGLLERRAKERGANIVAFGAHPEADVHVLRYVTQPNHSWVEARVFGRKVEYKIGSPGRHIVMNSLAVLASVALLGADVERAAAALAELAPPKGRGEREVLTLPGGGVFTLIDESYNANPASMRAALELLAQVRVDGVGRRVAILGDMRELGPDADMLHRNLAPSVDEAGIDLVFLCGPHMQALWQALPEARRGGYAATSAELEPMVLDVPRPGDVVMVKGSLGTRMGPIVNSLKARFRPLGSSPEGELPAPGV